MNPKDDKIKGVLPTLRQKKRYIKFRVQGESSFSFKDVSYAVQLILQKYLGLIELGKANAQLVRGIKDVEENVFVLRVETTVKDKAVGVLSLLQEVNKIPVKVEVLRVSGTLSGLSGKITH